MRIQHNISALNAHRQLGSNQSAIGKNLEKLSSGYKINRAGDDAAGLAISEKMRSQIKGLETASKNAQDGISLVQTAEGALTEVHSMLNRMTELATQSANGTYDNTTDRANLQKELDSLRSEVDRISKATDFNGIKLLDGSVNGTSAITAGDLTIASDKVAAGTLAKNVDGAKIADKAATAYQASFYVEDITNTSGGGAVNFTMGYETLAGTQTFTHSVADGASLTKADLTSALNADATFKALYEAKLDGNVLTITSKLGVAGEASAAGVSLNFSAFNAADVNAAQAKLEENYDGAAGANAIGLGTASGTEKAYSAAVAGKYQVASTVLTTKTADESHNAGIKVGDKTYVIQNGDKELKNLPTDATIVKVAAGASANDVAAALAQAITDDQNANGFTATVAGSDVTISETTTRGNAIQANSAKSATKIADVVKMVDFASSDATGTVATLDADKMQNKTNITVGAHQFTFVNDANEAVPTGSTAILFGKDDTSADLAQKLADAMTAKGFTGITADGASVKATNANIAEQAEVLGAGLALQVGDTNANFQKVSVQIGNMDSASLGISDISIADQDKAGEAIKAIKDAINHVSSTRGDLGAIQNRLEHTINNLGVTAENMTAAESRIRDVDMAKEMMEFTKNNILSQAATSMLAQANQTPQGVLQLLQ